MNEKMVSDREAEGSVQRGHLSAGFDVLRRELGEVGALPLVFVAITWTLLARRLVPTLFADRGIFVSVAERLLAGDILYTQVYDNKEPFFYYFVAGQRAIGPIAEPIAEVLLLLTAGISAYSIALRLTDKRTAFVIGLIAVPIILTGAFYYPGHTHLPGISLCLAAYALALRRRLAIAGALIGLLVFTKIIMVPLAFALLICAMTFEEHAISVRPFIAFAFALLLGSALLEARSEFWPFVGTLVSDVAYSHTYSPTLVSGSIWDQFTEHMALVSTDNLPALLLSIISGILVTWITRSPDDHRLIGVASSAIIVFVLSLGVLGATGIWDHHNQILYLTAVLVAICVFPLLGPALHQPRAVLALALVVGTSLLLGGATRLEPYLFDPTDVVDKISALGSLSPETQRVLALGSSGSYARLGQNDDLGHAAGLRKWTLLCPKFHQYPFESEQSLGEVYACASTAPVLLVANSFVQQNGALAWNRFVTNVEHLLSSSYQCDAATGLRVCTRLKKTDDAKTDDARP